MPLVRCELPCMRRNELRCMRGNSSCSSSTPRDCHRSTGERVPLFPDAVVCSCCGPGSTDSLLCAACWNAETGGRGKLVGVWFALSCMLPVCSSRVCSCADAERSECWDSLRQHQVMRFTMEKAVHERPLWLPTVANMACYEHT